MSYELLSKLYYKDPENYESIYQERLTSPYTVQTSFKINGSPAFFTYTMDVFQLLNNIQSLDRAIIMLADSLPHQALSQYTQDCLIDEIVLTNSIEGVHSTRKEIGDALAVLEEQSVKKGKHMRFLGMVKKYNRLVSSAATPLEAPEDIRKLYDEAVLEEVVEEDSRNAPDGSIFRKGSASVLDESQREIHRGVYPEADIISSMQNALTFLNDDTVNDLFRVCCFHYLFEYIHPFYDGNGRLGRLILSERLTEVLHPLVAFRISATIRSDLHAYYKAFKECNLETNRGDMTPFLLMMLQMLRTAEIELYDDLDERNATWKNYSRLIKDLKLSKEQEDLFLVLLEGTLFRQEGVSRKGLMTRLEISSTTLKKRIEVLKEKTLVEETREGRLLFYKLNLNNLYMFANG